MERILFLVIDKINDTYIIMKIYIKGLNPCDLRKVNIQHYKDFIRFSGHQSANRIKDADLVLIWSCGFRDDYKQYNLETIKTIQELYPDKRIAVTGCLPAIDGKALSDCFNGSVFLWRDEEAFLPEIFETSLSLKRLKRKLGEPKRIDDLETYRQLHPDKDASFSDQFAKLYISEGCLFSCTYCSERLAFPAFHSYPESDIIRACRKLIDIGEFDVMLQADSMGHYGTDTGTTLVKLLELLLELHPQLKIGMPNIHPAHFLEFFSFFNDFVQSGRALHLRVPIQTASNKILAKMKRSYDEKGITKIFDMMESHGFRDYSTDLIIGFPGETEIDFSKTLNFIGKYNPTYINLSMYLDSKNFESFMFTDKVSMEIKRRRLGKAERFFSDRNIYCNTDGGKSVLERQRRIGIME